MVSSSCRHRHTSAPTSVGYASLGAHRERPRAIGAWRVLRCAIGFAAITALAACGEGEGDPLNFGGSGTESVKPTVTLQLTPATVAKGQSATLTWTASEAQTCTASGGWSGAQPTSGTLSTAPLSASTSYTLTCTGSGGAATQSKQVVVTPDSAPIVTLAASPTTVASLGSSTLTWNAVNAEECTAAGGWHGQVATSGKWSTGPLSNTTDYELTCKGGERNRPRGDSPGKSQFAIFGRLLHPDLVQ